jgi:integration host factor subunit beta
LAIVKSKLLKQLANNYPNFLKKDLEKFTDIILTEIKQALKRGDRVELRNFGMFSTRNPKTGEKVNTPEKKTIHFKMSKEMFKKLNNDE